MCVLFACRLQKLYTDRQSLPMFKPAALSRLFSPRSVAVIGASTDPRKLGNIVVRNIIDSGFTGPVYPINPTADAVRGLPTFPRYKDLPIIPDLAIVAIPAASVSKVLKEVGQVGTKACVVLSAGFKEAGKEGELLEQELQEIAAEYGIALLGPNCLGFVNAEHPLNATFGQVMKRWGTLRFISQSGAIATSIFDWADYAHLGFSEFITLGNKAVVNESDVLEYWLKQEGTRTVTQKRRGYDPIGMYLESIIDGPRFLATARQLALRDPVFVLKPGVSSAAQAAMQSHTGALAGDHQVLETALAEAGVMECKGLEDVFDLIRTTAWTKAPTGKRVAIVSNAGGPAVITSDCIVAAGLELATLSASTQRSLQKYLPRAANIHNPVDVLGDALAERYKHALEVVLADESVDAVIVLLTPQVMTQVEETAEVISQLTEKHRQPIVCSFMGGSQIARGERVLNEHTIPSFRYPERAVWALGQLWKWRQWQRRQRSGTVSAQLSNGTASVLTARRRAGIKTIITELKRQQQTVLNGDVVQQLFAQAGIVQPPAVVAKSLEEIQQFANKHTYPLVLKISSPHVLHKSDVGGVITGIRTDQELVNGYWQLHRVMQGLGREVQSSGMIEVQQQIEGGVEVIVGVKRDATFGPVLMVGAGGVLAELIGEQNLGLLSVDPQNVRQLIERSKIYPLLAGYRGGRRMAIGKLTQLVVKLAEIAIAVPELQELEINPVLITRNDAWAVDGRGII